MRHRVESARAPVALTGGYTTVESAVSSSFERMSEPAAARVLHVNVWAAESCMSVSGCKSWSRRDSRHHVHLVQFLRLTGAGDRLTTPENYGHARVILRGDDLPFLLAVPRHSSALLVAPTAQV